jgi:hypothetical protein
MLLLLCTLRIYHRRFQFGLWLQLRPWRRRRFGLARGGATVAPRPAVLPRVVVLLRRRRGGSCRRCRGVVTLRSGSGSGSLNTATWHRVVMGMLLLLPLLPLLLRRLHLLQRLLLLLLLQRRRRRGAVERSWVG